MAERYQLVGTVDPSARIERWQYSPNEADVLIMNGPARALTPSQIEKGSAHVILRRVEEGADEVADFGPRPDEAPPESVDPPADPNATTSSSGSSGRRGGSSGGGDKS